MGILKLSTNKWFQYYYVIDFLQFLPYCIHTQRIDSCILSKSKYDFQLTPDFPVNSDRNWLLSVLIYKVKWKVVSNKIVVCLK